jgi:amino acid adenylation domain-containing protein
MNKKIIHSVFEDVVTRYSNKVAVESVSTDVTYSELNNYANRISHLLRSIGCSEGQIVNVIAPSSIELVAALLGVFKAGAVYLPVDLEFSQRRLEQIFQKTCDGYIIVDSAQLTEVVSVLKHMRSGSCNIITVDFKKELALYNLTDGKLLASLLTESNEWSSNPPISVDGDSSNYIFYTSGSTGDAKAIVGAHVSLSHFIHWQIKEFAIDHTFRLSQLTQVTFDASLRDIFTALLSGGTLCIPSQNTRTNPLLLLKWLGTSRITMVHCVPSLFRLWTKEMQENEAADFDLASLRFILMAGEMIYVKDIVSWRAVAGTNIELVNLYGPTETTLVKSFYRIGKLSGNASDAIPVGVPINNTVIAIIREGRLCRPGEKGEIYIKTPFMTKGYHGNKQLTSEYFVQNPLQAELTDIVYKTGDLGRYLSDGNIEVLGRLDNQVKVNGVRVEVGEIERAMLEMRGVSGAIVDIHRSVDAVVTLVAYYTGESQSSTDFVKFLTPLLNRQMMPSYFIHLENFPLNSNGKVDRRALTLPQNLLSNNGNFEAPMSDTEIILESLFKEVLGHEKVGRNISFFDIGGHSLRAIQLLSRIQKTFRVQIKVADIFRYNTISELASFIPKCPTVQHKSVVKVRDMSDYAMSDSQNRIWILAQLEKGNVAFNMPSAYVFKGTLNEDAFLASFQTLVDRHDTLRTTFKENMSGELRQWVHPKGVQPFIVDQQDLRGKADLEVLLKALIADSCSAPFDLAKGPLLRAHLFRVADDQWVFVYVMHHIISDGWSMNVIIKELLLLYDAYRKGAANPLKPLEIQYKDYLAWREDRLSDTNAKNEVYWKDQLRGELPVLELPTDHRRPVIKGYKGGVIHRKWNRTLVSTLKDTLKPEDATLYTGLLASVFVLLYRYASQNDIIVGSPFASRDSLELESQVGLYVNILPLRAIFNEGENFIELIKRVRETLMGAYEHQQYDIDKTMDDIQLKRDPSRSSLFDVLVVLQNNENTSYLTNLELEDLKVSGYKGTKHSFSKFDLSFYFVEVDGELHVSLEYSSDLFESDTAQRIVDHLEQMVTVALQEPFTPISRLDYLREKEKEDLLYHFNDTDVPLPENQTFVDLFEMQAEEHAEEIAVIFGEKALNYKSLNEISNQFARYLIDVYDIKPEDIVAVKANRDEWIVPVILGIFKASAAYMPIASDYPEERIQYIMKTSKSPLLVDADVISRFLKHQHLYSKENILIKALCDGLAYVIFTSGSTGQPKGAMIEHAGMLNHLLAMVQTLRLNQTSVIAQNAYLTFDISVWQLLNMLLVGGKTVIYSQELVLDPEALARHIELNGITLLQVVPSYLRSMLDVLEENPKINWSSLQYLIVTGESISQPLLKKFFNVCPKVKVVNAYGPAEAADDITLHVMDKAPAGNDIPVGSPIQNMRIYILDRHGMLCTIGMHGEICVSGKGVGRGYLNDKEQTDRNFGIDPFRGQARLYRTGDIGKWSAEGQLYFIGRKDYQIKLRGHRIELGEIENALQQYPGIDSALVQVKSETLVAYYTGKKQSSIIGMQTFLGRKLPAYMVPTNFIHLPLFPLNANGKIDRSKLPDHHNTDGLAIVHVPLENAKEEQLAKIWQGILDIAIVNRNTNFFEAGGHSLKITRLASSIHKTFEVKVSIGDLFNHPILSEQAAMIAKMQRLNFYNIPRAEEQQSYVLSSAQRRLWILSQFKEGSIAYHITGTRVLRGELNIEGLKYAFNTMIGRHESLRTSFRESDHGQVRQFIHPVDTGCAIRILDLRTEVRPDETVRELLLDEASTHFDLSSGSLIRASLYRTSNDTSVLSYTIHHIVSDGWSMGIFLKELLQLYNAYARRKPKQLPDLAIQYKDYAVWQQRQLGDASIAVHKAYWLDQFKGQLPVLELPTDKVRPSVKTYSGRTLNRTIRGDLADKLRKFVQDHQCSLFMGLVAVTNTLLYRYTAQTDIIVGSPVAGREHADLEDQIGFYLNILPLRTRFSESDSFISVLKEVRLVTLGAFDHQGYPFEELIADLDIQRDMSRSSLFDVMVVLHNNADHQLQHEKAEGLEVSRYMHEPSMSSKFDLSFDFIEMNDAIEINIEYNDDIFLPETAVQLADHFLGILEAAIDNPEMPVQDLDYLSDVEKDSLINGFNDMSVPKPDAKTVIELFELQVSRNPSAIALVNGEQQITYTELDKRVNQLANYLHENYDISANDLVGVSIGRNEWMIIAILGILKTGSGYVPIDPVYPDERIDHIKRDSGCKIVIDEAFILQFSKKQHSSVRYEPDKVAAADDLVYVMYTSGTTGLPKGVKVTNGNIVNTWLGNVVRYGLKDMDISLLQMSSLSFDVSMGDICKSLLCGGKMVICPDDCKISPEKMYNLMSLHRISILESTPGVLLPFMEYVEQGDLDLEFLKVFIIGSDVLNMNSYEKLHRKYWPQLRLINSYGTTETSIDSTSFEMDGNDKAYEHSITPIGKPLPNAEVMILNSQLYPQPVGVIGQIYIAGGGLSKGYMNRPDLTAASFVRHPFRPDQLMYKTGDLGRWLPDGNVLFIGRKDEQVKIRGFRIETGEVESILLRHPAISAAAVAAKSVASGNIDLVAYIVNDSLLTPSEMRKHISQFLPSFMVPTYYVSLPKLPLSVNGKIDKSQLPDPKNVDIAVGSVYIEPRNEIETILIRIWEEVLGRAKIGIRDDFFDLGGHSLKLMKVISRVYEQFNVKMNVELFFQLPFIENHAMYIAALSKTPATVDSEQALLF